MEHDIFVARHLALQSAPVMGFFYPVTQLERPIQLIPRSSSANRDFVIDILHADGWEAVADLAKEDVHPPGHLVDAWHLIAVFLVIAWLGRVDDIFRRRPSAPAFDTIASDIDQRNERILMFQNIERKANHAVDGCQVGRLVDYLLNMRFLRADLDWYLRRLLLRYPCTGWVRILRRDSRIGNV